MQSTTNSTYSVRPDSEVSKYDDLSDEPNEFSEEEKEEQTHSFLVNGKMFSP